MSTLNETLKKRNDQQRRVLAALRDDTKATAIEILLMWMSIERVDHMLKTLEKAK